MYLERLSASGIDTSPYYIPNGQFNTASPTSDVQMPNCTCYCYSRAFESTEAAKPYPIARTTLGYGNAKTWYDKSPLPKGSVLKTGSIAVFSGTAGHVAYCERVIDSNHALISQSQYDSNKSLRNYKYWEKREVELTVGKATLSGVGKLIGFIYLPINDIRVGRNTDKDQIQITEDMVNVRIEPNGDLFQKGCYIPRGIYNVLESRKVGEYNWYCVEANHWVREGEWLKFYPRVNPESELAKENEELKKLNEQLGNELAVAYKQLDEIRKIVC